MKIRLDAFAGRVPKLGPKLLLDSQSQVALDAKLWSGELSCFVEDSPVFELGSAYQNTKMFLKYREISGNPQWVVFDKAVDIVKGPVFADIYDRRYITGLDKPRVFDYNTVGSDDILTIDESNSYELAVPTPATPSMALNAAGSGDVIESRAYVISYVREWTDGKTDEGQLSAPASTSGGALTIDWKVGATVDISNIVVPTNKAEAGVKYCRIYRSSTGTETTTFRFVDQFELDPAVSNPKVSWADGKATYTDSIDSINLGNEATTGSWTPPIDTLSGIISLQNGTLVAFSGNEIYFSEPYQPHAWPSAYTITVDFNVIGLGCFGNNLVVCTDAYPMVANVQRPSSVILIPINELAPCVSKRSIVSVNGAVLYATPNGLISIDTSSPVLSTRQIFSRENWSKYNPASIVGGMYRGNYFASYVDAENKPGSFLIAFSESNLGVVNLSSYARAYYIEPSTDELYFIKNDASSIKKYIYKFDAGARNKTLTWKSKIFTSKEGELNLTAARIIFGRPFMARVELTEDELSEKKAPLNTFAYNVTPVGGDMMSYMDSVLYKNQYTLFKLFKDGELIFEKFVDSERPFRLPAGIRGHEICFELQTNTTVRQVDIATSMKELL